MYSTENKSAAILALKKSLYEAAMSEEYEFFPPTVQTEMTTADRTVLSEYQKENRLPVTGIADSETISFLGKEAALLYKVRMHRAKNPYAAEFPLKKGDSGGAVRIFQAVLCELSALLGKNYTKCDGVYGEETAAFVSELCGYFLLPRTETADESFVWRAELELRAEKAFARRD